MQGQQSITEVSSHSSPKSTSIQHFAGFNARWLLLAVVLLGLAVRCRHYLAAPSYWYDEAYVLVNVFDKTFAQLTGPLRCDQAAPPAFFWVLRLLYETFGRSEWAMRAPAFIASVLAVIAMIPLARRVVSSVGVWWAVGFLALSQTAVFHTVCVKPYSGDLLATVLVLLLGAILLESNSVGRRWAWVGLFTSGLILPWASYPSVFSLGGVTMALLVRALSLRAEPFGRSLPSIGRRLSLPSLFTLVWVTSFLSVWLLIGRGQYSNPLAENWRPFFVDRSSTGAAIASIGRTLLKLGHYGTTGMHWPLILLGGYGAWRLGRISFARLALIAGPLALMFVASALNFYPLEDRLFFFALPCLWLLAAAGIDGLLKLEWRRWRPAIAFLLAVPLLPGAVRYVYWLAIVPDKVEYRQAFAYVQEHERPGDGWWVSHPEVFEVYFGKDRPCNVQPSADRRAWLILARGCDERAMIANMGCQTRRTLERHEMQTVTVLLFDVESSDDVLPSGQ